MSRYSYIPRKPKSEETTETLGDELLKTLGETIAQLTARVADLEAQQKHQPDNSALLRRLHRLEASADATQATAQAKALPDDYGPMRQRLNDSYANRKHELKRQLRALVLERYEGLEFNLARDRNYQLPNGTMGSVRVEDLPKHFASELTGELQARQDVEARELRHKPVSARLRVMLETYQAQTADLLVSTDLPEPPTRLAMAMSGQRPEHRAHIMMPRVVT